MSSQISELIHQWGNGDRDALKKFLPLIYNDLRQRARFLLKNERSDISWQGTELVHELYFDLAKLPPMKWNRGQFFAFAVNRMRLILVDHARQRSRKKRGGSTITISLDGAENGAAGKELDLDVVALHDALGALAETNARRAQIVELKVFGGYSVEEIAEILKLKPATIKRDWNQGLAWLRERLE